MKPNKVLCAFAVVVALFVTGQAFAYNPFTHSLIADRAVALSNLADSSNSVLGDWGFDAYNVQQFPNPESGAKIDGIEANQPADSVAVLIRDGAAFEDLGGRPVNHFYDPLSGYPLNIPLNDFEVFTLSALNFIPFSTSPDWTLQDIQATPDSNRGTALNDVPAYLYRGLTMPKKADRDVNMGYVFDILGHAVHHMGDMAQPQHVRNDMHCDKLECAVVGLYNASRYEAYTSSQNNSSVLQILRSVYTVNPADFAKARSFWYTPAHKGLAEFTNSNFVSAGTNFTTDANGNPAPNSVYHSPAPSAVTTISYVQVFAAQGVGIPPQIQQACSASKNTCQIKMYGTDVVDNENPSSSGPNPYASTLSIFDQDLKTSSSCLHPQGNGGIPPAGCDLYSLNYMNFNSALHFLLPRAAGYGAGLIDYVFRGRLDVQATGPNSYTIINKGTYPISAPVEVYYDGVDGNRYEASESSGNVLLDPVNCAGACNNTSYSMTVSIPTDKPAPAKPGVYMFVMNGTIGTEPGVAGKLYQPPNDDDFLMNVGDQLTGPDLLQEFSPSGALVNSYDSGFQNGARGADTQDGAQSVAIYGTQRYAAGTYKLTVNGNVVNTYDGFVVAFIAPLAVDKQHLYVGVTPVANAPVTIDQYDHNGANQSLFMTTAYSALNGLSANGTRLCLGGLDMNSKGAASLVDYQGNLKATLDADPGYGGGPCASTTDRHYLAYTDGLTVSIYVYDNDGNHIAKIPVDGTNFSWAYGIAANDHYVYVSNDNFTGDYSTGVTTIAVFKRVLTLNSDGSIATEQFVRQPDITTKGASYDDAADMQSVLTMGGR